MQLLFGLRMKSSNENPIVKILGTSDKIFFQFEQGEIVLGSGEFMAKSRSIDGFYVYTDSLRYRDSHISLTEIQKLELIEKTAAYQCGRNFSIEFI